MKKLVIFLSILVLSCLLVGCKDTTYAGLHVTNNTQTIQEICRTDGDFDFTQAKLVAQRLAEYDFKEIKYTDEYIGGNQKKVIITDANDLSFIIILIDNEFKGVCDQSGNQIYVNTK